MTTERLAHRGPPAQSPSSLCRMTAEATRPVPTASQRAAVNHGLGPALVLAGPGSGKTTVLIWRYERLVREERVVPERILLLTFGRNAAAQLRAKMRQTSLAATGSPEGTEPTYEAFTFHAFAMQLVREFGSFIGLPSRTRALARAADKWRILEGIVRQLKRPHLYAPDGAGVDLGQVAKVIEDAKKERVSANQLATWAAESHPGETALARRKRETLGEIADVYREYVARNRAKGEFDFDDYVLLALELLEIPEVREEVQRRYDHVMVDEYQDTSAAQAQLAERVAGAKANLLVVADDDQSIYKFRGASRHNVLRFQRQFPGCIVYPLLENRRSTPQIVRASLAVMAERPNREQKTLAPVRPDGYAVRLLSATDLDSESLAVADQIARGHGPPNGIPFGNFAILARTRGHLARYGRALRERGIPFTFPGSRDYFRQPEVKDAIALLRVARDPDDDIAVLRLLNMPRYEVGRSRFALAREARESGSAIRSLAPRIGNFGLDAGETNRFEVLVSDIEALALLQSSADATEVLHEALERSRYVGLLDAPPGRQHQGSAVIRKLVRLVEEFCVDADDPGLEAALDYLQLLERTDDEEDVPAAFITLDAVRLNTVHAAKGLEFPHVFVVELMRDQFPLRERRDELELPTDLVYQEEDLPPDPHDDEERRLFYVGMTRAQDTLTISYSARYFEQDVLPSPFLDPLYGHADARRRPATPAHLSEPEPAEEVPYTFELNDLSYSHLEAFHRCPRRFAYAYYYRYPVRPQAAPLLGQLVHDALFQGGVRKRRGEDIGGDALADVFDEIWEHSSFDKRRFADLREHGRTMLRRYGDSPAWRDARPAHIEQRFDGLRIGDHTFSGQLDRLDAPAEADGTYRLVDYKTGRPKLPEQLDFDDRLQLALYARAAETLSGPGPLEVELHFLQDSSVVPVMLDDRTIRHSLAGAQARAAEIRLALTTLQFPPKPSRFNCTPCVYRGVCDEGRIAVAEGITSPNPEEPLAKGEIPF